MQVGAHFEEPTSLQSRLEAKRKFPGGDVPDDRTKNSEVICMSCMVDKWS